MVFKFTTLACIGCVTEYRFMLFSRASPEVHKRFLSRHGKLMCVTEQNRQYVVIMTVWSRTVVAVSARGSWISTKNKSLSSSALSAVDAVEIQIVVMMFFDYV